MLSLLIFASPFNSDCVVGDVPTLECAINIFPVIITLAIVFAFIASLILIIYSGFKFVTSGGDEKQVEGAKKTLTYSIIGLVVVLASFFIIQLIGQQTGAKCINVFGWKAIGTCATNGTSGPACQTQGGVCQTIGDCCSGLSCSTTAPGLKQCKK